MSCRRHGHGCLGTLFLAFCGVAFVGVLMELASVVAVILGIAVLVIVINRVVTYTRRQVAADRAESEKISDQTRS